MAHDQYGSGEQQTTQEKDRKHFMVGLQPGPPPDHKWQEYCGHSIYVADQHRSLWQKHTHDCTQITIAMSPAQVRGEWVGTTGRVERRELNGDVIWIVPPGVQHIIHFNRKASLVHLYIDEGFFRSMLPDAPDNMQQAVIPSLLVRDQFLVEIARSLYREAKLRTPTELFTQSVATLTATHLVRAYSSRGHSLPLYRGGLGPSREKNIRAYIDEHLSEELSLEELARVVDISPNYLISLFRDSIGMTPHKYVLQQRIERARRLLARSGLSLLGIAQGCGFRDQSQFTTIFRRSFGVTPGQYRRQI
jgi:AraC family transcriptional regulator